MGKYISINNEWIIDISEIQSVHFEVKKIETLYSSNKLSKRFTQLTGQEIPKFQGLLLNREYDIVRIELKSGHKIVVEDFTLKSLKEYIISQLEIANSFECAEIRYYSPAETGNNNITLDGGLTVEATLKTGDYPVDLGLSWSSHSSDPIDVKLSD
ncbi:MAG: hypothetical protein V7L13_29575 [Nostoc sp.]|uniref:hypothetical protein n=1 Tax=Nostoc sp. TaxID=1180 RepID=UPI002FF902C1